jgi:hypothetical protein
MEINHCGNCGERLSAATAKRLDKLCLRHDVVDVTYHRNATPFEIKQGYGSPHYRTFTVAECCHEGTRITKKWFKADDGLRYYR